MEILITSPRGTITIRQAQVADVQAFRELRLEALHNHPEVFSADYAVNAAHPALFWTERLRTLGSEGMIYFADCGNELAGMCGIHRGNSPKEKHSAVIWGVYVRPEWRGLHIAEALLTQCIEWARTHGVKIVKLGVVTTNTAAIRCYTRCDFAVYGTDPQAICHEGVMYDELLMARMIQE